MMCGVNKSQGQNKIQKTLSEKSGVMFLLLLRPSHSAGLVCNHEQAVVISNVIMNRGWSVITNRRSC
jgi:hypothetical protein